MEGFRFRALCFGMVGGAREGLGIVGLECEGVQGGFRAESFEGLVWVVIRRSRVVS